MPAAYFELIANIAIAAMFVASFAVVAKLNPGRPGIGWFAASYAMGGITPIAELMLPSSATAAPFMILSYASLLAGLSTMVPALQLYYRQRPRWDIATIIVAAGVVARWIIWGGNRDDLGYEFAYQAPFAAATATSAFVAWRAYRHSRAGRPLAVMFAVLAAHFLLKPFAAAYFGSGNSAAEYSASTYALFSQALSGILLIAAGLVLLLTVLQELVQESRHDAHSDALTGLPNRRALAGVFEVVRKRAAKSGIPASIAIVDIDHFKNFNDRWGHDTGDAVLRAVARCLESACPPNAVVARLGGEEFVVLMPGMPQQVARLACEKIRIAVSQLNAGPSAVTVSLGLSEVGSEVAELPKALRPADIALYHAKAKGRNRTSVFEPTELRDGASTPIRSYR